MPYTTSPDFYSLLQIPRDASPDDIKIAYHRTLLRLHPDKLHTRLLRHHTGVASTAATSRLQQLEAPERQNESSIDMELLKEAYRTLSDTDLRTAYDRLSRLEEYGRSQGPRPAQVVSLEEFTTIETRCTLMGDVMANEAEGLYADTDTPQEWRYGCRCGGTYRITEGDLENGMHLVACESCSEVIWVGYEEVPGEGESAST